MYRPPSPIFDVPELPTTLRRVKPLPKRRRTSDPAPHDDPGATALVNASSAHTTTANASASPTTAGQQEQNNVGADGEEQGHGAQVQDSTLAAQMTLQAYYQPVLGGVRDLFKPTTTTSSAAGGGQRYPRTSTPVSIDLSAALAGFGTGAGFASGVSAGAGMYGGGGSDGQDDEDGGEGDYIDHLQQPGNTKKRKVPANMSGSAHGHDAGSGGSGAEDDPADRDRGLSAGRERDIDAVAFASGMGVGPGGGGGGTQLVLGRNGFGVLAGKKGRLSRATLAGLQHKEVLKSRKRQLAAVLGALSHGDTLALDQALSASYLFAQAAVDPLSGVLPRIRLSRRREPRLARALKAYRESLTDAEAEAGAKGDIPDVGDEGPAPVPVPSSDFTFVCHSATSDRLVATKEEVAILHSQFETELTRQAAKAAEAAKQAAAGALSGPLAKRTDRSKLAARTAGAKSTDQKGVLEQSLLGTKGKGGKKKKRSALANASNPHHLRNYVPSRLPHSGPPNAQQAVQNAQNLLTPLPLRFLSAEIPPRRRKKSEPSVTPVSTTLTNPADEWICPFCEYQLFYGDEQSYHRAVRNRKKILRRRRRARERAAAAASGATPAAAAASDRTENEDVHPGFETPAPVPAAVAKESASAVSKQAKWKEGDRGGHGVGAHV